jgi:hypothetical protein
MATVGNPGWVDPRKIAGGSAEDLRRERTAKIPPPTPSGGDGGGNTGNTGGNTGNTGGGGSRYYGSGGGGGSSVDKTKVYVNYYRRILGIKPNTALVNLAAKEGLTMQQFQLLVQRKDTKRFLGTAQGQDVVSSFRSLWAQIFPSLKDQPNGRALYAYLQQKPTKNYKVPTNPSNIRDMYAYLSRTKAFKNMYGDFAGTKFEGALDFSGYRDYRDRFKQLIAQYTGKPATDTTKDKYNDDVSYFFRSNITPEEFEKGLQIVLGGRDAYNWSEGASMDQGIERQAMYGRTGSMQTLQKIAGALEAQQNYLKANQAQFEIKRNDLGKIEQPSLY